MLRMIDIIKQYNNYRQLGAEEDIIFLKEKIENLLKLKDMQELIKDFTWCVKMTNIYWNEVDSEFKKQILKEEREVVKKETEIDQKVQNND